MEESTVTSYTYTADQSKQLLTISHGDQREGAGEQNGSCEAKKQSSSSQAETNLLEEQHHSLTSYSSADHLGISSGGSSGGLKKSSSSGSIPSSNSQRQQLRSVRKTVDHFDAVKERRRQIEEKRKKELEKQMSEKDKRRQKALEMKRNSTPSKQSSTRLTPRKVLETPSIFINSPSPELTGDPRSRVKSKPTLLLFSNAESVSNPKPSTGSLGSKSPPTPKSPRTPSTPKSPSGLKSPSTPKTDGKRSGTSRKTSPTQGGTTRKPSPTHKAFSFSNKPAAKKTSSTTSKRTPLKMRKLRKQDEVAQPPPIPEVTEPTGSEDSNMTDELIKVDSYSSVTEMCIYFPVNEPKSTDIFSHNIDTESDNRGKRTQRRRLTQPGPSSNHPDQRKSSHPAIKFPEKVEMTERPANPYVVTSEELERRKKEYKPRASAVAFVGSMRPAMLESAKPDNMPLSAPVSRVTTPASSRSNSPKRHVSAVAQATSKNSPLLVRKTSEVSDDVSGIVDICAPPHDQLGTRRPTISISSDKSFEEGDEFFVKSDSEEANSRKTSLDFPSSYFELRPQEACLYTVYNEGTELESELYKMALTDEQVDRVAEISLLPNSLEQLLLIVPKVQEYLEEGVTTFKILSTAEYDGSRSSYIICSSTRPPSGTPSSDSSAVSLSSFDF